MYVDYALVQRQKESARDEGPVHFTTFDFCCQTPATGPKNGIRESHYAVGDRISSHSRKEDAALLFGEGYYPRDCSPAHV